MGSRKKGPRALEIYRFVREQERSRGGRPPWPELMEAWNVLHPAEKFEDYSNLRTYFMRGAKPVEDPGYRYPKPSPAAREMNRKLTDQWIERLKAAGRGAERRETVQEEKDQT